MAPPAHQPQDPHHLIGGASPAEVLKADDEHAAALAQYQREMEVLSRGEAAWEASERDAFDLVRDELIRGPLRTAIEELMDKAGEAAHKLEKYAPIYEAPLLAKGSTADIETWRQTRQMQDDLEVLRAAWLASSRREYVHRVPRRPLGHQFRPERAGGWYAWTNPDAVTDEALRLGRDREILRIARADSEYRLIASSELVQVIADLDAKAPREHRTGPRRFAWVCASDAYPCPRLYLPGGDPP